MSSGAPSPSARAWSWVLGQRGTGTAVTSASFIAADRAYPADWTGAVSGTFVPHGVSAPILDPASVVVDSPASVPGTYAGVVAGHVTVAPQAGRWIVQVYRDTASGRVQVPLQTLVGTDGRFSVDLGSVSSPPAGTWALGLLDATQGYAPSGTAWPAVRTYQGWIVRASVVTDTAYVVGEQPARADGTFAFPDSRPGSKIFQLVDVSTGHVLAEAAPDFGLVRSYAGGTRSYTYDQALAVITSTAVGDATTTADLTGGLMSLQRSDGSFVESADVRNPQAADPITRTGINAVATYALLRRLQTVSGTDPTRGAVESAARSGVAWLRAQRRSDGLIGAGQGDYRTDGSLDPAARPAWASTEHNLDAWQALHLAANVLGDVQDGAAADDLATAIVQRLWNDAAGRFREGLAPDGTSDNTDPLDVSSWGALFLQSVGRHDLASRALTHCAAFASTTPGNSGYRAYYPQAAFPQAPANVWSEGGAGVAVARVRLGDTSGASADLAALSGLQATDGSLPYATVRDDATGMSTAGSVAGSAWFILASQPAPPIWN